MGSAAPSAERISHCPEQVPPLLTAESIPNDPFTYTCIRCAKLACMDLPTCPGLTSPTSISSFGVNRVVPLLIAGRTTPLQCPMHGTRQSSSAVLRAPAKGLPDSHLARRPHPPQGLRSVHQQHKRCQRHLMLSSP